MRCYMRLCMGRILNVLDLRGCDDMREQSKLERSMFGSDVCMSQSISGHSLKDDIEAGKRVERLYRAAIKMMNAYEKAMGSIDADLGGHCHHMPLGIVIRPFGASLVSSREDMRVEYFQPEKVRRSKRS